MPTDEEQQRLLIDKVYEQIRASQNASGISVLDICSDTLAEVTDVAAALDFLVDHDFIDVNRVSTVPTYSCTKKVLRPDSIRSDNLRRLSLDAQAASERINRLTRPDMETTDMASEVASIIAYRLLGSRNSKTESSDHDGSLDYESSQSHQQKPQIADDGRSLSIEAPAGLKAVSLDLSTKKLNFFFD